MLALASGAARAATKIAPAPNACPDPETIVRKLQERYDTTRTFKAGVRQEMKVKSLDVSDVSEGTVIFKKPGKMRWDSRAAHAADHFGRHVALDLPTR